MSLREDIEREATAARAAVPALRDDQVAEALRQAGAYVRERRGAILEANSTDVARAEGVLDAGTLDRLRLDESRVEALARQIETMAEIPPLEREVGSWTLENGLRVSERRIPIGVVGATPHAAPISRHAAANERRSASAGESVASNVLLTEAC